MLARDYETLEYIFIRVRLFVNMYNVVIEVPTIGWINTWIYLSLRLYPDII